MPTTTDISTDLADVTAWLRAWKGAEREVLPEARAHCLEILASAWNYLFENQKVPRGKISDPEELADQLKAARTTLESQEKPTQEQLKTIKTILANTIAFFSTNI